MIIMRLIGSKQIDTFISDIIKEYVILTPPLN